MMREGKPGPGRPKGVPNKATAAVREAIAAFAEANVDKLQTWLDATAEKHPDKAADLFLRALEYFTPKLFRVYVDGLYGYVKDGKPVFPEYNDGVFPPMSSVFAAYYAAQPHSGAHKINVIAGRLGVLSDDLGVLHHLGSVL